MWREVPPIHPQILKIVHLFQVLQVVPDFIFIYLLSYLCYIPHPSNPPSFDCPYNHTCWLCKNMMLSFGGWPLWCYNVRISVTRLHKNYLVATGPTPDWIVGVSGLNLCSRDCTWTEQKVVDLYPWDAGTDSGISYMASTETESYSLVLALQ
jgi:hypothetical protein